MNSFDALLKSADMNQDFLCCKFRIINKYLIESLVNPSLYFAKPDMLNDPFDCRINLKRAFQRAELCVTDDRKKFLSSFLNNSEFFENSKTAFGNLGVFSSSMYSIKTLCETLLWTHYADEHKGVCLVYSLPKFFITTAEFQLTAGGIVNYSSEPLTEWLKNDAPLELRSFAKELALKYLKTKSPSWQYEKEARIIRREHGVFNIHGNFIKQVIFGLRTPKDDVDLVRKLAMDYCGCNSFWQIVHDESDFGLTIKPLGILS